MALKLVVVLLMMLLAVGVGDARIPEIGDHVFIATSQSNTYYMTLRGEITDIGEGLICLHGTAAHSMDEKDYCIGVGSIVCLEWI